MAIGYKIVVSGQYRAHSDRGKVIKSFRNLEFILPERTTYSPGRKLVTRMVNGRPVNTSVPTQATVNSLRIAKSLLMFRFLPPRLRELYDDYASLREMNIMSQTRVRVDDEMVRDFTRVKIAEMTEPELIQFHALHDLNCVLGNFSTLSDKKVAVEREYQQRQAKARAEAVDRQEREELSEPAGVLISGPTTAEMSGAVTSADGVPIDEQDPAEQLI